MMIHRPEDLAIRSVGQYRRRDVLTYLGLRYYLENAAARRDVWANTVAVDLILARSKPQYGFVDHFKGVTDAGQVQLRRMALPCPNEVLAEAALLADCSRLSGFRTPPNVYSYELAAPDDRTGLFRLYVDGWRRRENAIAVAAERVPNGVVRYTDIKAFYPSLKNNAVRGAWLKRASEAGLRSRMIELGEKLILDHSAVGSIGGGEVLTGPMVSHLLANLFLQELDEVVASSLGVEYFRYVDDIVLVGEHGSVQKAMAVLDDYLSTCHGLHLHRSEPKSFEVSTEVWLAGHPRGAEAKARPSWVSLIGDLKKLLLRRPESRTAIVSAFRDEGLRIPVGDYSEAVREALYVSRVAALAKQAWYRWQARSIGIRRLVRDALTLRTKYEEALKHGIDRVTNARNIERKRVISRLRYYAARVAYLGDRSSLPALAEGLHTIPELHLQGLVLNAIGTGKLDAVLRAGTNVAQATAQPLRAGNIAAEASEILTTSVEEQSLAILHLNGVDVRHVRYRGIQRSELLQFAERGVNMDLLRASDPFVREIACLHGSGPSRHPQMLESAFDVDDIQALDVIEQLQVSGS